MTPWGHKVVNRLSLARRTQIIGCLVEGNSIRSTERMTDTHRDTIMRLMVQVGEGCAVLTPAMAAGVTDRLWSLEELVERTSN